MVAVARNILEICWILIDDEVVPSLVDLR